MEAWHSDAASSHHTRQRYKEGLIQQGREEAMKEMVMGSIKEVFTSTDPKMVEMRMQMLRQAGLQLPQDPAGVQAGQMVVGTSQLSRYPADEITKPTLGYLYVPVGRGGKMKQKVGEGQVLPPGHPETRDYGADYAIVQILYVDDSVGI
jgi:hypothetical protein